MSEPLWGPLSEGLSGAAGRAGASTVTRWAGQGLSGPVSHGAHSVRACRGPGPGSAESLGPGPVVPVN